MALELLGVSVLAAAWLCSLASTLMSTWLIMCADLLPTVTFQLGLWEACVIHEAGTQGCQPHASLLGLPHDIQTARVLMCLSLTFGILALLVTVPGMTGVKSCGDNKRGLRLAGGALGLGAGVLGIAPVSYVAHLTVERFFDETLPEVVPRWEFGDAMFCGWTAGVLHLLAGALLLASGGCRPETEPGVERWRAAVNMGYPKAGGGAGTRSGTRTSTRYEYV